jgi:alkanesulfonate monooxygenase SsuD/methylene tetrahydromethanopterin reductase-like flavin-dependent oxidoreductase (luciferase family)
MIVTRAIVKRHNDTRGRLMRLCANWLPVRPDLTREVAARCEAIGLWGMGIGDSPRYGELYSACTDALSATTSLVVSTSVTNPVTRHWSVHASGARTLGAEHPGRFRLGVGRGDSAVHTFGLRPASLKELEGFATTVADAVRESGTEPFVLLAASGPAAARAAGRVADGIIAGVGADPVALDMVRQEALGVRTAAAQPEVWASVRIAVGQDDAEVARLRERLVPRAVSASHFAFASTFEGKNVPEEIAPVLAERYATYDYGSHGRSGRTSNATMFSDRPDIEDYLVRRFAVVGVAEECREQLEELSRHVDGIYLSLLFEDALEQLDRIGGAIAPA